MLAKVNTTFHGTWCWHVQTGRLPRSGKRATPSTNGWGRLTIRCFSKSKKNNFRRLRDVFWTRTTPFWGFHGSPYVLQTLRVAPPSWIQHAGNDVNQDLGRPFRSPLRRRRNMAALPHPAAILDDLIPGTGKLGMRSSKMAAGSGRAAILRLRLNGDRKGRPILL